MATFEECRIAIEDGTEHLKRAGDLEELYVHFDRDAESYVLKAVYGPGSLKENLKNPVKINTVRVLVEERKRSPDWSDEPAAYEEKELGFTLKEPNE